MERFPGKGNSYPLQYSGLKKFMDSIVDGVAESDTTERLPLSKKHKVVDQKGLRQKSSLKLGFNSRRCFYGDFLKMNTWKCIGQWFKKAVLSVSNQYKFSNTHWFDKQLLSITTPRYYTSWRRERTYNKYLLRSHCGMKPDSYILSFTTLTPIFQVHFNTLIFG